MGLVQSQQAARGQVDQAGALVGVARGMEHLMRAHGNLRPTCRNVVHHLGHARLIARNDFGAVHYQVVPAKPQQRGRLTACEAQRCTWLSLPARQTEHKLSHVRLHKSILECVFPSGGVSSSP